MLPPRVLGLRHRIFLSYSVTVVVLVVGVALGLTLYLRTSLLEQEAATLLNFVQKSSTQVDDSLRSLKETAVQVGLVPEIVDVFTSLARNPGTAENRFETDYFDSGKQVVRALAGIKYEHYATGRISLYNLDGSFISFGRLSTRRSRTSGAVAGPLIADLSKRLTNLGGLPLILDPHPDFWSDQGGDSTLSVLWNLKDLDRNVSYGIVEVQQAFGETVRLVQPGDIPGAQAMILGAEGQVLWESTPSLPAAAIQALIAAKGLKAGSGTESMGVVAWSQTSQVPWTIVYLRTQDEVLLPLRNSILILALSALVLMGLSLGVVLLLSIRLSQPLYRLRLQLDRVDLNNLSVELETGADADVRFINRAFTQMFERLQTSTQQLLQSRAHESRAHLLALQSQMDPHFLFNILSVLTAEARALKAERLEVICTTLAETLRYVSDYDTSHTTMAAEFHHVESYLKLMRFRFEEGLEFQLSPCSHAEAIAVPKLILQPVVENCFRHGFADRQPPWVVHLDAQTTPGGWQVAVEDNGCGLSGEEAQGILDRVARFLDDPSNTIESLKIGGLGLVNSLVRLKLQYGDQGHFELGRSPLGGTRIVLSGPIP